MLLTYCGQRLFTLRIALASIVIAAAAQVAAPSWRSAPIDVLLAFALIVQFRIWDDLADRPRDAIAHPERATVRATWLAPLVAACALAGVCALAIVVFRGAATGAIAGMTTFTPFMALWYTHRGPHSLAADHVLLGKYPVFVWIVAVSRGGAPASSLWLAMTAVFLAASVHEAVHDGTSPGARSPALLVCEALALCVTLMLVVSGFSRTRT